MRLYILVTANKNGEQVMGITSDQNVVGLWTKLQGNEYYSSSEYLETEFGAGRIMETWEPEDRCDAAPE